MIYHQSVVSEIQCEDLCLRIPRCLAYNYQYSGKHDENERACELMNSVVDVKSSVGFSFRLFERNRANKVRGEVIDIEILLLEFRRGAFTGSFPVYFSCFSFVGLFLSKTRILIAHSRTMPEGRARTGNPVTITTVLCAVDPDVERT